MASQLLATKSIDELHAQEASGNELRRALTATQLTLLGIGGIIGTGIFVLTGTAAANHAGPALALSFIIAGIGCTLAGLCYAEFAAMIPVSGSAYSYSYATLGEGIAWFIGWNLVLEYLFAVATVSVGWSGYVTSFLDSLGIHIPAALSHAPFDSIGEGLHLVRTGAIINVPAMLIVSAIATICYIGIKQSAVFNSFIVVIKVTVVVLFILFGVSFINTANWHPFIPPNTGHLGHLRLERHLRGLGRHLLRLHRLRRHLHRGAGNQEPAARHADRDPGEPRHLHRPLRHRGGGAHRHGELQGARRRRARGARARQVPAAALARLPGEVRRDRRHDLGDAGDDASRRRASSLRWRATGCCRPSSGRCTRSSARPRPAPWSPASPPRSSAACLPGEDPRRAGLDRHAGRLRHRVHRRA